MASAVCVLEGKVKGTLKFVQEVRAARRELQRVPCWL